MSSGKNTSAATESELKELHGRVARMYLQLLDRYESGDVLDIKGNVKGVPASVLAAAAKFLNDNGVDRPEREVDLDDPLCLGDSADWFPSLRHILIGAVLSLRQSYPELHLCS